MEGFIGSIGPIYYFRPFERVYRASGTGGDITFIGAIPYESAAPFLELRITVRAIESRRRRPLEKATTVLEFFADSTFRFSHHKQRRVSRPAMRKPTKSRCATPAAAAFPLPECIPVSSTSLKSHSALYQLRNSELFACLSAWLGLFGEELGIPDYDPAVRGFDLF